MEQLGYYPNLTARSLRAQKTNLIAAMIADITNPFYHTIVRTVQDIARQRNYDLLIANTDHQYAYEKAFCEAMMRRPVDGIIMVPFHLTENEIDTLIKRTGAYVVALAKHWNHPQVDAVFVDDERAVFEAVNWLIHQKGHQRIGFIGVPRNFPPGLRRWNGFVQAMDAASLPIPSEYVQEGDWSIESGKRAMATLLDLPTPPTAVFACNDFMAIGAIGTALDRNWVIPRDVAIVGFDDIPLATTVRPRLTTIAQPSEMIGRVLGNTLFDRIEGIETGMRHVVDIPGQFVERDST